MVSDGVTGRSARFPYLDLLYSTPSLSRLLSSHSVAPSVAYRVFPPPPVRYLNMRWSTLVFSLTLLYSLSSVNAIPHDVDEKRQWLHKRQVLSGSPSPSVSQSSSSGEPQSQSSSLVSPTPTPTPTTLKPSSSSSSSSSSTPEPSSPTPQPSPESPSTTSSSSSSISSSSPSSSCVFLSGNSIIKLS